MNKRFICILFLLFSINVQANAINSVDITTSTISAAFKIQGNCLRYQIPTRYCVWFRPFYNITVTPVLNYHSPDLIVTVYRNSNGNPWTEAKILFDQPAALLQENLIKNVGSGNHSFLHEHEQQVIFKEVDVIGNPAVSILPQYLKLTLESGAVPMKPYYQSMTDSLLWRGFMPQALPEQSVAVAMNSVHHVGTGIVDWGGIYPHEGSVIGNNDLKASMVIAQRAVDLLMKKNFYGHIYQSFPSTCGQQCKISTISENSEETLFQMIYPVNESSCYPLGNNKSYSDSMINDEGAYAWIVWLHYQGCKNGLGHFVGIYPR